VAALLKNLRKVSCTRLGGPLCPGCHGRRRGQEARHGTAGSRRKRQSELPREYREERAQIHVRLVELF